ncbi:hypothetical protein ACHAWF_009854, partial [Thalassiosira exigua]
RHHRAAPVARRCRPPRPPAAPPVQTSWRHLVRASFVSINGRIDFETLEPEAEGLCIALTSTRILGRAIFIPRPIAPSSFIDLRPPRAMTTAPVSTNETTPLQQPSPLPGDETLITSPNLCDNAVDCLQTNSFVIKAALAIIIAHIYPPLGAVYVHPEVTATWLAVVFIFLMAGLSLQSNEFAKAAARWRFNLFVMVFNFGVVSLLVFVMTIGIRKFNILPRGLTDGMMVCACMPITVSMVIVLTKSAQGDEAAAVLLAAVGSLLGVIVTPALLLVYIGVQSDVSFGEVILKLALRVVAPLVLGQFLQSYSAAVLRFVNQHKAKAKGLQEWALVFIVFTVFSKTFSQPIDATLVDILWMTLFQGTALLASMGLAWYSLKFFFRNEPKLRVMGLYGCTQKSVAVGIPMIGAIYEHDPRAGMYTLPLLVWHPLQLLIGSALAPHLAIGVELLQSYLSADNQQNHVRQSFFATRTSFKDNVRRGSSVAFTTLPQGMT